MLFKQFTAYALRRDVVFSDLNDLNNALYLHRPRPLSANEQHNQGFTAPFPRYRPDCMVAVTGNAETEFHGGFEGGGDGLFQDRQLKVSDFSDFSRRDGSAVVITYFSEEKVIVGSAVKRELDAKIQEIEDSETRKVYNKEKQELRFLIVQRLLPNAQTRYFEVPIVFLPGSDDSGFPYGLVIVGATGAKAERASSHLRTILGTLPVTPLDPKQAPHTVLTQLAIDQQNGENTTPFTIASDFQMQDLRSREVSSVARMKNTDIDEESVIDFLVRGQRHVTHADLTFDGKVAFNIDPKFTFRKLRVDSTVYEEDSQDEVDFKSYDYVNTIVELSHLSDLLAKLMVLFGGPAEDTFSHTDDELRPPLYLDNLYEYQRQTVAFHGNGADKETADGNE